MPREPSGEQPAAAAEGAASPDILLDDGPGKHRIGLLALANDLVVEGDLARMRPDPVMVFTSRVPFEPDCSVESLAMMAPRLSEAASRILPGSRLDAMIYACTSGTAVIGVEQVAAAIQEVRPGIACVTPIDAAWAAFAALELRNIAVVTPYVGEVSVEIASSLESGGVQVIGSVDLEILQSEHISAVTPETIEAAALAADRSDADGLFIACTDFRSLDVVSALEHRLGKAVVTSNQAMFWKALRSVGYGAELSGFGKLLHL